MLTPDQLAALRAAAEAATPGPWEHQTSNGWHRVGTTPANRGRVVGDVVASGAASPADMAHIAAANPAAVQGLLADLEAMAQELLAYRADSSLDTAGATIRAQAARIAELERDAARYRWLTQDAYIGECFTDRGVVLEICGTDREIPVFHERATDREEVDAAIDAALMESNALTQDIVIGA
ncbi:ead/Ea22-like family protein [Chromobacterium violaceum]